MPSEVLAEQKLYIGGQWHDGAGTREVHDRWTGEVLTTVSVAGPEEARAAVDAAHAAMSRAFPVAARSRVLATAAELVSERAEEFALAITAETGKPIAASRGEVARGCETLRYASEEARRLPGETVPLDAIPAGEGTFAMTISEPRGIVAAITPFNFPLNLLLHKVAPAIAAGCSVVLKPSDRAVVVAGLVTRTFVDAGLPPGRLNLVTGRPADTVDEWLADPRVQVVTFTGSSPVGWSIKARSPEKLHILELGSNTAMVVTDDADLDRAADAAVTAALANSGQACISLQRLYATPGAAQGLLDRVRERFAAVVTGDPRDPETVVGPMISEQATRTLHEAILSAAAGGARVLAGGEVVDGVLQPTLLADVDPLDGLVCDEAFGPVLSLLVVDDLDAAIEAVNASEYALNTAIYTSDLATAMEFSRRAEAGTVLVNMPPSFRADHMPYGGVKGSGQGTEGVKYAIHELTHQKLVVLRP